MNRKGQTLVAFVLLVPVFLLLFAFVIDTGYLLKESTRLNSTTKTILKTTYENRNDADYKEQVRNLMEKNAIPIENLNVTFSGDFVSISNQYFIESIFGKIIGIKEYEIKNKMHAKMAGGAIVVNKE